jgi:hypothetical protein
MRKDYEKACGNDAKKATCKNFSLNKVEKPKHVQVE